MEQSNTRWAQGGVAAVLREDPDSTDLHLADTMAAMMRETGIPNGVGDLGYTESDIPGLVGGAFAQQRLLAGAPLPVTTDDLSNLYRDAMRYW